MDKMDAQVMLSLLFWSELFNTKPGLSERSWCKFSGSQIGSGNSAEHEGRQAREQNFQLPASG